MAEFVGIIGYNFEPEWAETMSHIIVIQESSDGSPDVYREQPALCECGQCVNKPTAEENLCCKHSGQYLRSGSGCIVENPTHQCTSADFDPINS